MLLRRVERHMKEFRVPPARFGREALNDPCFVFNLRDGREPRPSTERKVDAYMAEVSKAREESAS